MPELTPQQLFDVLDATWPAQTLENVGPFVCKKAPGAGRRVTSTVLAGDTFSVADIVRAEDTMARYGQECLFMIRDNDTPLDEALAARNYQVVDPVVAYAAPAEDVAEGYERSLAGIPCDAPLAAQREIWADDGIGPERLKVMARSSSPRTYLMGRHKDRITGTVFVALRGDVGMLHALCVAPSARKMGVGTRLTQASARWVMDQGGSYLSLVTTRNNAAARKLYERLGMTENAAYHYRLRS